MYFLNQFDLIIILQHLMVIPVVWATFHKLVSKKNLEQNVFPTWGLKGGLNKQTYKNKTTGDEI